MQFTAQQIAELIGGTVEGNPQAIVNDFAKIEEGREGTISFLSNPKYTHYLYTTASSVVLVGADLVLDRPVGATLIRVPNAYEAVAQLLQAYQQMQPRPTGISPLASIDPTATIGADCYIAPFAVVEAHAVVGDRCQLHPHAVVGPSATIGSDTTLYATAVVYHHCRIGNHCTLHAGSVVGADGFGFAPTATGYDKIPQIGNVVLDDNVEIGANTCIDRSTMGSTHVRQGVKLDNLVQIAHNTDIGANTVMSAQTGVAGSAKIGQWCMLGGQVGVAGHITVGNQCQVGAQSGIMGSLPDASRVMGYPAQPQRQWLRQQALLRRIEQMQQQLADLQARLK